MVDLRQVREYEAEFVIWTTHLTGTGEVALKTKVCTGKVVFYILMRSRTHEDDSFSD